MNWPIGKVSDIADIISGYAFKSTWFDEGDDKIVRIGDLQNGRVVTEACKTINASNHRISEAYRIREGDILMALSGATVGKIAVADAEAEGAFLNQRVAIIRGKSRTNSAFLKYAFSGHLLDTLLLSAGGAAQPNLSPKKLAELEIPLPPLDEQKRIAAILDKADAIRQKRKQAIALADDFLRSVFLDMFGDPVTNPKGWEVKLCKNIFKRITVGVVVKPSSYYVERGIPALRSLNISPYGIDSKNLVYISSTDNEQALSKSRVYEGDLVLVRSGQPGKTAVITNEFSGVNAIDILIATPDRELVEPDFFAYFMNSAGGQRIVGSEQRGQIQKHFNVGSMNAAEIPLPPLEKQKEFCKVLSIVKDKYLWNTDESYDLVFNSLSQKAFSDQL
ncbi:TPA: restriction endonuclease subunit S [Photobacterium damselae]